MRVSPDMECSLRSTDAKIKTIVICTRSSTLSLNYMICLAYIAYSVSLHNIKLLGYICPVFLKSHTRDFHVHIPHISIKIYHYYNDSIPYSTN